MTPTTPTMPTEMAEALQKSWWVYLLVGIAMIVLGLLAISAPLAVALAVSTLVGWLLLIGGAFQLVHAFRSHSVVFSLLTAALYLVTGFLILTHLFEGLMTLTLLLAAFFVAQGVIKIILAFRLRPLPRWGWLLASGNAALILGGLIWSEWPGSAAWAIGLLVGIDLLFFGWSMTLLALSVRAAR